ncbi:MAG: methylated-DNA--[protein]-cysteine S-methyltransferase [Desulfonatronovibrio sp.]
MREYFANRYFSLTIIWQNHLIRKIELGPGAGHFCSGSGVAPYSPKIASAMKCYEHQKSFVWPQPPLDWSLINSYFQKNVLKTLLDTVPFGKTISYGQLARLCGSPGAARAVGRVMSVNPWPVIIPCHRVISGGKGLGGFSSGLDLKKTLLELESRFFTQAVANLPDND